MVDYKIPQHIIESNSFGSNAGAKDLARHLYTRMLCGKVLIINEKPLSCLSALRKQWLKLARKVQLQRASTLDATKIYELTEILKHMYTLKFTAFSLDGDVCVVTREDISYAASHFRTIYLTSNLRDGDLKRFSHDTDGSGSKLIVICKLTKTP